MDDRIKCLLEYIRENASANVAFLLKNDFIRLEGAVERLKKENRKFAVTLATLTLERAETERKLAAAEDALRGGGN